MKIGIQFAAVQPYVGPAMASGKTRALTEGEKALARSVFRDGAVDLDRVRIRHGAGANPAAAVALRFAPAVTMVATLHFRDPPPADFSASGSRLLFLHELTHVWQYRTLGVAKFYARYAREWARHPFNRLAMYEYERGDPFGEAALEAQADMVRDYSGSDDKRAKAAPSLKNTGLYGL